MSQQVTQQNADFVVLPWSFSDTEATVVCQSRAASHRYPGIVSLGIRISAVPRFTDDLRADGHTVFFA